MGAYEAWKQEKLKELIRPGMCCWDVGANVGFHTLAMSSLAKDGAVVAFEPLPRNAGYLQRHLEINRVRNVTLVPVALGETEGVFGMENVGEPLMARVSDSRSSLLIQSMNADLFVDRFPELRPDFIKMDVEGAEFGVLKGAVQILRTARPTLLVAVHSKEIDLECRAFLEGMGYQISCLTETSAGDVNELESELLAIPNGSGMAHECVRGRG